MSSAELWPHSGEIHKSGCGGTRVFWGGGGRLGLQGIIRYPRKLSIDFKVKETGGEPGVFLMVFATEIDDFTMRSCSSGDNHLPCWFPCWRFFRSIRNGALRRFSMRPGRLKRCGNASPHESFEIFQSFVFRGRTPMWYQLIYQLIYFGWVSYPIALFWAVFWMGDMFHAPKKSAPVTWTNIQRFYGTSVIMTHFSSEIRSFFGLNPQCGRENTAFLLMKPELVRVNLEP